MLGVEGHLSRQHIEEFDAFVGDEGRNSLRRWARSVVSSGVNGLLATSAQSSS